MEYWDKIKENGILITNDEIDNIFNNQYKGYYESISCNVQRYGS